MTQRRVKRARARDSTVTTNVLSTRSRSSMISTSAGEPSPFRGRVNLPHGGPGAHPCKRAFDALKEAGHSPDVVKV